MVCRAYSLDPRYQGHHQLASVRDTPQWVASSHALRSVFGDEMRAPPLLTTVLVSRVAHYASSRQVRGLTGTRTDRLRGLTGMRTDVECLSYTRYDLGAGLMIASVISSSVGLMETLAETYT